MAILRDGSFDRHKGIEAVDMHETLAVGAGHRRVDLGDRLARHGEHRGREIDGHAQADEAARIRRGDLEHRHVDWQPTACQESRHLFQTDRHVVEPSATGQVAHVAADEERPVAIASPGVCFPQHC